MNTFPKSKRLPKPPVRVMPDLREICNLNIKAGKGIYTLRIAQMVSRQRYCCAICGTSLNPFEAPEFDHEAGRGLGGAHRDDRIEVNGHWKNAAVHHFCNMMKGSKRYHWINGKYIPAKERGTQ